MADWTILFAPGALDDLEYLGRASGGLPQRLRAEIASAFHDPFKSQRFQELLEGHGHTGRLDRLESSGFPKSFRIQLLHDFRATFCALPEVQAIVVSHVFAKSADPKYLRAVETHDARLEAFFLAFKDFADRAETRRTRRRR